MMVRNIQKSIRILSCGYIILDYSTIKMEVDRPLQRKKILIWCRGENSQLWMGRQMVDLIIALIGHYGYRILNFNGANYSIVVEYQKLPVDINYLSPQNEGNLPLDGGQGLPWYQFLVKKPQRCFQELKGRVVWQRNDYLHLIQLV